MSDLVTFLNDKEDGPIPEAQHENLQAVLYESWGELYGSDSGGMKAEKLMGRMEEPVWERPILSFIIERHGATQFGSSRAELQHWRVDISKGTAGIERTTPRQMKPMDKRFTPKEVECITEHITQAINQGSVDKNLKWLDDEKRQVRVVGVQDLLRATNQRTRTDRSKRLRSALEEKLERAGWVGVKGRVVYTYERKAR